MKLRNKKTGIIEYLIFNSYPVSGDIVLEYMDESSKSGYSEYCRYKTLAELNEEWEDYAPKEPLIKDEKIRKVVRAWAEANEYDLDKGLDYTEYVGNYGCSFATYGSDDNEIHFCKKLGLEDGRDYTIEELCGEEEK